MTWQNIRGHDRVVEKFRRALVKGRLASTFLFVGPSGIGKRTFALALAKGLLCERVPEQRLDPCGECPSCLQVASLNHPDVEMLAKPPDKASNPLRRTATVLWSVRLCGATRKWSNFDENSCRFSDRLFLTFSRRPS